MMPPHLLSILNDDINVTARLQPNVPMCAHIAELFCA